MTDKRWTVAVDFDGVLHSYTSPWIDAATIPDPPVEGAIEWLNEISKSFNVVVMTTRGGTHESQVAVREYLVEHGYRGAPLEVTSQKVPALIYVDDRGYRFDGTNFPSANDVHRLRPWNKS